MQDPRRNIDDVVITAEDGSQWVSRWRRLEIEAIRDGEMTVTGEAELLPAVSERSPGHMRTLPVSRTTRVTMPLDRVPQELADALALYLRDEAIEQGPELLDRLYNPPQRQRPQPYESPRPTEPVEPVEPIEEKELQYGPAKDQR